MDLSFLAGKSVLITGGTGSFGQMCVRTLLRDSDAARIIVFSRDELKQSEMLYHIADPDKRMRYFIGDIRDVGRLELAFRGVDYVIHAAALKQVPALEYNPFEAVKTNIIGTQNVIEAAMHQGVKKVILVSTDKAANPANLYGATKLCAEKLMISANAYTADVPRLSVVRYGNVFGSRGSIIQLIKKQRRAGKISLTHEEMTRFWITLPQGIAFVFDMLACMQGGEIFVPKIPSMKIRDVIKTLAPECEIEIIGIRPGEKLHEVLITVEEARHAREFEFHYIIFPEFDWWNSGTMQHGLPFPEGAHFASHLNTAWLTQNDVLRLAEELQ